MHKTENLRFYEHRKKLGWSMNSHTGCCPLRQLTFHPKLVTIYLVLRELAFSTADVWLLVLPPVRSAPDRLTAAFVILRFLTESAVTFSMLYKCQFHMLHRYQGKNPHHLQCDVPFSGGTALQFLICTASWAPPQWDTSRYVDVLHIFWELVLHIHQLLHGSTHAPCQHLHKSHCVWLSLLWEV